ncbi:hypothetical protein HZH66_007309 [Vespula vulgaris]|uniref:Uncharacterized protein n=1 Tax=Vespula vulgaris TaxID=7454 RepID=A0A834JZE9_VESVU|nr:hypothetical protein HZH66_007309 [Vespula vulgaris]
MLIVDRVSSGNRSIDRENVHPRQARCGSGDGGGGGRELAPRTDQYLKHRERPVARTKSFYLTTTANEDIIYPSFVANVAGLNSPAPIESERYTRKHEKRFGQFFDLKRNSFIYKDIPRDIRKKIFINSINFHTCQDLIPWERNYRFEEKEISLFLALLPPTFVGINIRNLRA